MKLTKTSLQVQVFYQRPWLLVAGSLVAGFPSCPPDQDGDDDHVHLVNMTMVMMAINMMMRITLSAVPTAPSAQIANHHQPA